MARQFGVRISVTARQAEAVVKQGGVHGEFRTDAAAAARIHRHAAQTALCKACELAVLRFNAVGCVVHHQSPAEEAQVAAQFVVPCLFGLVGQFTDDRFAWQIGRDSRFKSPLRALLECVGQGQSVDSGKAEVLHAQHHIALEGLLCQLRIGLQIVAARAITLAHSHIHIAAARAVVIVEGKLRKHLPCVHLQTAIDGSVRGQSRVDTEGRHGKFVVRQGAEARIEVKAAVVVFHAQSQRGRDACPEAHCALVVERSPRGGCLHGGGEVEALVRKGQRHRRIAGQNGDKLAVEEGHAVGQEGDGTGRIFALQPEVGTAHPLPAGAVAALQGNLLREGVHALALFQGENVGTEEVLVHKEAVA